MFSAHNEGKSVVVERFIRNLKNKIHKHLPSISKNVLADIVNKYNNKYHSIIKLKPVDVKSSKCIDSGVESKYVYSGY